MSTRAVGGASASEVARLHQSMARLYELTKSISETADEVMARRCPYKDARSRCTANFGCRNQFFTRTLAARPVCAGSDKLDYRSAWDV